MAGGTLNVPNTFATQTGNVPASQLDDNNSTIETYVNNREVAIGLLAARPAAGTRGQWFFATDVNGGTLYADTGSAWQTLTPGVTVPSGSSLYLANSAAGIAAGTTAFVGVGVTDTVSATNVASVIPIAGTVSKLYAFSSASPGVGQTYTITLLVNEGATAITATISGAGTTATDLVNSVGIAASDRLEFRVVTSAGANTTRMAASVIIQP